MIGRWIFVRERGLTKREGLALGLVFLFCLIALFPLRFALEMADPEGRGFAARGVEGTVWSGRIGDFNAGPLPLGTVRAGVRVLPLLLGRGEFWLQRPDAAGVSGFSATGAAGEGWVRLRDMNGSVPLGDSLGALPASSVSFTDFHYSARDGRCQDAGGTVSLTLSALSSLMPGEMVLGGKARCERGALLVPMTGPTGMERLSLRLQADGEWTADLLLTGLPPEVATPLLEQGFSGRDGGLGLRATGKF